MNDGKIIDGPQKIKIIVKIDELPVFERR
jgi:hypothetical protein